MRIRTSFHVRRATAADADNIRALQDAAFRIEARTDYEPGEVDSFLRHAGALETALIEDGTWFIAEIDGEIVASGGWSARAAPYTAYIRNGTAAPADSAVIRGVYVDPAYAAAGLAQRIVDAIEDDIASSGYKSAHLATIYTSMPFYTAAGYRPCNLVSLSFPDGYELHGVAMTKGLSPRMALAA